MYHLACQNHPRYLFIFLPILLFLAGCSTNGSQGGSSTSTLPAILIQPGNQSIPMGLAATFKVTASGLSLQYQWSRNGTPISGATGSSYTTAPTLFNDTASSFTVSVSNSLGSTTSNPAILTVTARAPKVGDLRFQQVDAPSTLNSNSFNNFLSSPVLSSRQGYTYNEAIGTELYVGTDSCQESLNPGADGCLYQFSGIALQGGLSGLATGYYSDILTSLQSDIAGQNGYVNLLSGNIVITSIAISPAEYPFGGTVPGLFGLSYLQDDQATGFTLYQNTVPVSGVAAAAAQEGQLGRVVTAVSYSGNQVFYLSYSWSKDTASIYETQVATATLSTATTVASNLAAQGYILTAFGGDENGLLIVGTRVQGDTMSRPILSPVNILASATGYAIVGVAYEYNSSNQLVFRNYIAER